MTWHRSHVRKAAAYMNPCYGTFGDYYRCQGRYGNPPYGSYGDSWTDFRQGTLTYNGMNPHRRGRADYCHGVAEVFLIPEMWDCKGVVYQ